MPSRRRKVPKRRWLFSRLRLGQVHLDASNDPWADIATYVWRVRLALNMAQADLATTIGVSERTVRRWEGGVGEPTASQLRVLLQLVEERRGHLQRTK